MSPDRKAYNAELKEAIRMIAETNEEISLAPMERLLKPAFEGRMPARPTLAKIMLGMGWTRHPDDSCAGAYYRRPA